MGYTTAFTPPFQATLPKARSAKSRVTMSMSSPGGNNDDGGWRFDQSEEPSHDAIEFVSFIKAT